MKKLIYVLLFLFVLSCGQLFPQNDKEYFLKENIDESVNPANDFFNYANGSFIKRYPIPQSEHTYGIFNLVEDSVYEYLRRICEEAVTKLANEPFGSNMQKIGDFYNSGLDTASIESAGIEPIQVWLKLIDDIKTKNDLINAVIKMHKYYLTPLFYYYVAQDLMISSKYSLYFSQGGLGLPDREYYFKTDERTANIRTEYLKHISNIFVLFGYDKNSAGDYANTIMNIETSLAFSSRKLEELRDDYANYNKYSANDLKTFSKNITWVKMINDMGISNIDTIIIGQPEFFQKVDSMLNTISIEDWKTYLKWNLVNETASLLCKKFDEEHFKFYGGILSGTTEQRPRYKRVLDNTNSLLGEILGQEYVRLYFPPEDKLRTVELVNNMVEAFKGRINSLDWMSEATKKKAVAKLNSMIKKIGYPDKWKDYSTLTIGKSFYVENVLNAYHWEYNDNINRIGKPVDRTEWGMNPQTYNAYYNPSNNEIVIPAAILTVPGKKMSEVDDAFLYGFIGASTIGHEMTHGFDDQGRLYDENGNLNGWWTIGDSAKFVIKSELMIDQFNNYVVLDSMHINGKATLGENIADLGGLVIGYDAMKNSKEGKENIIIGGFTCDQRYFLGYAYSWAVYYRPEMLARRVMTDVHSPPFLRVNGPYSNINAFYKAFNVTSSNTMYRDEKIRISIW